MAAQAGAPGSHGHPGRLSPPAARRRPALPPEDCGGMWAYDECVRAARGGEDLGDRREWLGDWDPDAFDLETTRRRFDR
ncbi:MAG: IS1096 element passenger TnpR family protein [Pseudonocardiaceae bacterium]